MYPKRKTYLRGTTYQCHYTPRGRTIEDIAAQCAELKQRFAYVVPTKGGFTADGLFFPYPEKGPERWDVVDFTQSSYFTFNGERVPFKHIRYYNPENGTFQTTAGFFTLYPLPA